MLWTVCVLALFGDGSFNSMECVDNLSVHATALLVLECEKSRTCRAHFYSAPIIMLATWPAPK
jgi:hypothetical protein